MLARHHTPFTTHTDTADDVFSIGRLLLIKRQLLEIKKKKKKKLSEIELSLYVSEYLQLSLS